MTLPPSTENICSAVEEKSSIEALYEFHLFLDALVVFLDGDYSKHTTDALKEQASCQRSISAACEQLNTALVEFNDKEKIFGIIAEINGILETIAV